MNLIKASELEFKYFAMSLFNGLNSFEIRVVAVDAKDMNQAVKKASQMMKSYASDFGLQFSGLVNVFEAGSDMIDEYGEVFSLTCHEDRPFESAFEEKLSSPIGIRSIVVGDSQSH